MANEQIRSIPGTEDVLPSQSDYWHRLYGAARRLFALYGYGELRTPVIEDTRLFVKGTGETTDIVEKQMYSIPAGEDAGIALRPEGTPSVIRAYLQANLHKQDPFRKFFYIGPMFRHERPQKGRLREFYQIGVEVVGSASPLVDAETIILADRISREVGLTKHRVVINSIGDPACRTAYRERLREALHGQIDDLCEDCKRRFERNVLRVLDCKEERCKAIVAHLPTMAASLSAECRAHHDAVKGALARAGIAFEVDPLLVRGLDYYTRTVFEIKHSGLGARDAIGGGGRYDGLVELLGGPSLPAVGWAMGTEATLLAMEDELGPPPDPTPRPAVYVVCFEEQARPLAFELITELRGAGIPAEMDFLGRSSKAQMRTANKVGARLCLLLGRDELDRGEVTVKNMAGGEQWSVSRREAAADVARKLKDDRMEGDKR